MVGLSAGMEQSSEKFTEKFFGHCRGLAATGDFGASWDDGCDGRNKTIIKWFAGIENTTKL